MGDGAIKLRPELLAFAVAMEKKLRKNDHKTGWHDQPLEAHVKFLLLELEEFKVALEFLKTKDARGETIDIANFALILWDKLGRLDQEHGVKHQPKQTSEDWKDSVVNNATGWME